MKTEETKKSDTGNPKETKSKQAEQDASTNDAMADAPQAQPEYKPDANTLTDNRRSDYDQPNLNNPESQAIHRDITEDGGEGDKPENHEGDKAWDVDVKEDDEENRKDAEKSTGTKK